jgi:hypothetical protein
MMKCDDSLKYFLIFSCTILEQISENLIFQKSLLLLFLKQHLGIFLYFLNNIICFCWEFLILII